MLIFNFHHVEPDPRHADRKHITITPDGLRHFIRSLRALGKEPVALRQVLAEGGPAPGQNGRVLLTFDDGYANFYQYALPVLEAERCPATVFVLPGKLAGRNDWDQGHLPKAMRDPLMSREQIEAVAQSDWVDVGSHGLHHQDYSALDEAALKAEIEGSHAKLSEMLGSRFVPVLAYPWGRHSETARSVLAASRYHYAFTTEKGRWTADSPPFAVPRYSVYYRDGNPLVFIAKLCRNGLLFR